jgi:hypothetical protein
MGFQSPMSARRSCKQAGVGAEAVLREPAHAAVVRSGTVTWS